MALAAGSQWLAGGRAALSPWRVPAAGFPTSLSVSCTFSSVLAACARCARTNLSAMRREHFAQNSLPIFLFGVWKNGHARRERCRPPRHHDSKTRHRQQRRTETIGDTSRHRGACAAAGAWRLSLVDARASQTRLGKHRTSGTASLCGRGGESAGRPRCAIAALL